MKYKFLFASFVVSLLYIPPTYLNATALEQNMLTAKGEFQVKITPQSDGEFKAGRMTIDKTYQGDLVAIGKGQMLTAMTEVKGSAGYVAIEHVEGTLEGQKGSFALQHSGTMAHGSQSLKITVVPDSGTGELKGLSGKMSIDITDGKHFYSFEYLIKPVS